MGLHLAEEGGTLLRRAFLPSSMDRPVHLASVLALCSVSALAVFAQDDTPGTKRTRAVSPRVAEMLSAATASLEPMRAKSEAASESRGDADPLRARAPESTRANDIVRLPDYVVRERKPQPPLTPEQVMGPRALEKAAMQEFLGDEQGLDRALNTLTLAHLWKKIPVLGRFPFNFVTNEERAMMLYRADREAKKWAELGSFLTPEEKAAIRRPTGSAPQKK